MLRNGQPPTLVAQLIDVPFALAELIAEHLPPGAHPADTGHKHETEPDRTGSDQDIITRTDPELPHANAREPPELVTC